MREILTIVAAFAIAILAAALAIPPFVDWGAHAGRLGAGIGAAAGAQTKIAGPLSLRLLPTPRLSVGHFSASRSGISVDAASAHFELALVPLLRGVVTVTSAALEQPRITLDTETLSKASLPAQPLVIERLELRDATIVLQSPQNPSSLEHVDLTASAETLAGPFKGDGFIRADNRILPIRFATGAFDSGSLRIKANVDPLADLPHGEADGSLTWRDGMPSFEGNAVVAGEIAGVAAGASRAKGLLPWRLTLAVRASPDAVDAANAELRLGDEDHSIVAAGSAAKQNGIPRLALSSQRLDLDRFAQAYDLVAVSQRFSDMDRVGGFDVSWHADSVIAGGDVLSDVNIAALGNAKGGANLSLAAGLPAQSNVSFKGTLSQDSAPHLRGNVKVSTRDTAGLSNWIAAVTRGGWSGTADWPFRSAEVSAAIDASLSGVEASGLHAALDRSQFSGAASYARASDGAPARLSADLTSPALDLDALPDLSSVARNNINLSLSLDAKAIHVARVGSGTVEAGRIKLALTRKDSRLSLDRLSLENFGGATLQAHGGWTDGFGSFEGTLDAVRLNELSAILSRVSPGPLTDAFASRASLLSPAHVESSMEIGGNTAGTTTVQKLNLSGKAAATAFTVSVGQSSNKQPPVTGNATLDAPEVAALLRQAGIPVLPLRGQGAAHFEGYLSSASMGGPSSVKLSARVAGTDVSFDGTAKLDLAAVSFDGASRVASPDASALLRVLAYPPPDAGSRTPLDIGMQVKQEGRHFDLASIAGSIFGTKIDGNLTKDGDAPVTGALHLDHASAPFFAGLLLGAPQPAPPDRLFSNLKFSTQPNDPPSTSLDLAVDRFELAEGIEAADFKSHIVTGPGAISFSAAAMSLGGGHAGGRAALRREGDTASLEARINLAGVRFASAFASGRATGSMDVSGAGTGADQFMQSLNGKSGGFLHIEDFKIVKSDPDAIPRVVGDVEHDRVAVDQNTIVSTLAKELEKSVLNIGKAESPIALAAGLMRAGPTESANAKLQAVFDLATGHLTAIEEISAPPPLDWTGPAPRVTLAWDGTLQSLTRKIDAAALTETLAAHAIVRETARNAAIDADLRERRFFNRRLKFDRALEAARQDSARREAARQEALRQEAARQEAARQEAARQERDRKAAVEKAAVEKAARALRALENAEQPRPAPRPQPRPFVAPPAGADPSNAGRY